MKNLIFIASTVMSLLFFSSCEDQSLKPKETNSYIISETQTAIYEFYPDQTYLENQNNELVIYGSGFSQYSDATYVEIGPLDAYIESMDENTIHVRVPRFLTPGYHEVKVVSNGQVFTFENKFFVNSKKF